MDNPTPREAFGSRLMSAIPNIHQVNIVISKGGLITYTVAHANGECFTGTFSANLHITIAGLKVTISKED